MPPTDVPTPVLVDPAAELTALHTLAQIMLGIGLIAVAAGIVSIIALWRVFTKAGEHGWAVLVPVYGLVVMLRIAVRSPWWVVAALAPSLLALASLANRTWMLGSNAVLFVLLALVCLVAEGIVALLIGIGIARAFGRSTRFGVVALTLVPIVGYCLLGFGGARYFDRPATPAGVLM
jgi:hypothetical protein